MTDRWIQTPSVLVDLHDFFSIVSSLMFNYCISNSFVSFLSLQARLLPNVSVLS